MILFSCCLMLGCWNMQADQRKKVLPLLLQSNFMFISGYIFYMYGYLLNAYAIRSISLSRAIKSPRICFIQCTYLRDLIILVWNVEKILKIKDLLDALFSLSILSFCDRRWNSFESAALLMISSNWDSFCSIFHSRIALIRFLWLWIIEQIGK